ncbi:MAG: zinc ribbon domain-containing protein [Planctomycetota bacterium]|nr:MAG: zinc ribbon domain-containing protein [Planctomycetota bacterium]
MPLYEFLCRDCNQEQEQLVRADETPVCESCGSQRLMKLLSVPAAHASAEQRRAAPNQPCGGHCQCFPQ